jgi:hypothetical protein
LNILKAVENNQTQILGRRVKWMPYSFSSNFTRVFYCNAIAFVNFGTSTVSINDVFVLNAGDDLSLECDQNEIDTTVYKITFGATGTRNLQLFVKENLGQSGIEIPLTSAPSSASRRDFLKKYSARFKKNSDF